MSPEGAGLAEAILAAGCDSVAANPERGIVCAGSVMRRPHAAGNAPEYLCGKILGRPLQDRFSEMASLHRSAATDGGGRAHGKIGMHSRFAIVAGRMLAVAASVVVPGHAVLADQLTTAKDVGSGFYVWIDGGYERVALPAFTLGPAHNVGFNPVYAGQLLSLNANVDGYGVSGGVGYRFSGNWPGTNARIEVGGRYVGASGSGTQVTAYNSTESFSTQMVSGRYTSSFSCIGTCTAATQLSTSYSSGQVHLRAATDYAVGSFWLTPSVALFGGQSRSDQTYNLTTNNGFLPFMNDWDSTDIHLKWRDVGVRAGLDGRAPLGNWLSVGLGGWIGVANRRTDLAASDSHFGSNSLGVIGPTIYSSVAASDTRAALLANLEANVYLQPMQGVTLRAFGGLSFDNATPGIRAPSFIGTANGFTAPTVAAGISYSQTTGYYAGGGLRVGF